MTDKTGILFEKGYDLRYLSHLDLMRVMIRGLLRAKIEPCYTEGFNPHPKIAFALPLPVGVFSKRCYMEAQLVHPMYEDKETAMRLQACLPAGLIVHEVYPYKHSQSMMSRVDAARYAFIFHVKDTYAAKEAMKAFLFQETVFTQKKTKRGMRTLDIKPLIRDWSIEHADRMRITFEGLFDAGSKKNLSPMVFLQALLEQATVKMEPLSIERMDVYAMDHQSFAEGLIK